MPLAPVTPTFTVERLLTPLPPTSMVLVPRDDKFEPFAIVPLLELLDTTVIDVKRDGGDDPAEAESQRQPHITQTDHSYAFNGYRVAWVCWVCWVCWVHLVDSVGLVDLVIWLVWFTPWSRGPYSMG